jgi:hypothetical protein
MRQDDIGDLEFLQDPHRFVIHADRAGQREKPSTLLERNHPQSTLRQQTGNGCTRRSKTANHDIGVRHLLLPADLF